MYPLPLLQIRH